MIPEPPGHPAPRDIGSGKVIGRLREDSQCQKILAALQRARGKWVSMPALVAASGSFNVHSRIDELRRVHGFQIENQTDVSVRPHISRYRLLK